MSKSIFSFEKLYQAYLDCRETKRKTINALKFEWNLERNLFQLQKELETKRYRPGRSICFVVKDPSPREIFAASFKDRVVHHFLINEIESIGERRFIFDTFSCRKNKGTHLAIKRLKRFVGKVTENYTKEAFYAQLDISGFFMAIDHRILYSLSKKLISRQNKSYQWKRDVLWLAKIIIFHNPTKNYITKGNPMLFKLIPPRKSLFDSGLDTGLPIGNYSSQFFGNLYLNELDQFIKRELRCNYYVRYVDDFIFLDKDKEKLKSLIVLINEFLKTELGLELRLSKTKLQPIDKGIEFLGYFVKSHYVLVRKKVVSRFKDRLYKLNPVRGQQNLEEIQGKQTSNWGNKGGEEIKDLKEILAMINSYYGHFSHAFSFRLRKDMYENHLGKLRERFLPKRGYCFLKIKK